MIDSAQALGDEVVDVTLSYIAWRAQRVVDDDRPLFALGLLLLLVLARQQMLSEEDVARVVEWVIAEEQLAISPATLKTHHGRRSFSIVCDASDGSPTQNDSGPQRRIFVQLVCGVEFNP
jgi:hypothetical protein